MGTFFRLHNKKRERLVVEWDRVALADIFVFFIVLTFSLKKKDKTRRGPATALPGRDGAGRRYPRKKERKSDTQKDDNPNEASD